MTTIDTIEKLFREHGDSQYGFEVVTQREHALQAATFAENENADATLIAAALLHDIGHMLHDLPDDTPEQGIDDRHGELGQRWLCRSFDEDVTEPVRLHVAAKRYLCAVEPGYRLLLSEPSIQSMKLQGGEMRDAEIEQFRSGQFCEAAVRLRKWDDAAKVVNLRTPTVDHFLAIIATCCETP